MKKKILALSLAVLMLCGLMTGCIKQPDEGGDETSVANPRDMFIEAIDTDMLQILFGDDMEGYEYVNLKGFYEAVSADSEEKVDFDFNAAAEEMTAKGDFTIEINDEKLSGSIIADGKDTFLSIPEVNELPIKQISEDSADSVIGSVEVEEDSFDIYGLLSAYLGYIKSGKLDSLFEMNQNTVIIRNVQFENANVITLYLTDDKVKELMGADFDEEYKDFDIDVKIEMVQEGESAAFKVDGTFKNSVEDETENVITAEHSSNGTDMSLVAKEGKKEVASLNLTHNNIEGNENGKVEIKTLTEYDEEETGIGGSSEVTVTVDYKNGKGDIEFNVAYDYDVEEFEVDDANFKVPFEYGIDEDGFYFLELTGVETKESGITITMDISAIIAVKPIEKGFEFKVDIDSDVMEMAIDLHAEGTLTETEKVEIKAPEEYDDYEDIAEEYETTMLENYPHIAEFMGIYDYDDGYYYSGIYIENEDASVSYTFDTEYMMGYVWMDIDLVENTEDGKVKLHLANGEIVEVEYANADLDNETIEINGLVYEFLYTPEDELYYEEYSSTYCNGDNYTVATISYYPETEDGYIYADFDFEAEGDVYTLTYFDGATVEKTILYNEETEEYYFAE